MAHYKKRPKVKRYRRSFYSKKMKLQKGLGIAALVLAVLLAAWVAAPHVLDWATHTWYTVVRHRDLSVPAASSVVSSQPDPAPASSQPAQAETEPEPTPAPEAVPAPGAEIVEGRWAEVSLEELTDEAAIRAAAEELAAQGVRYGLVCLKDSSGQIGYASGVAAAANSMTGAQVDAADIAAIFKENGIAPVAAVAAFRDPVAARTDRALAIHYTGQEYLWLDNKAEAGGQPWLNPCSDAAVQFVGDLVAELHTLGFDHVLLENVQFPSVVSAKQEFHGTVVRHEQLAADIAAWQARFGSDVTLWYGYSLTQVTDTTPALGVPAAQLGMKNLLVEVPEAAALDGTARTTLMQLLADAGIEHAVLRDEAAGWFE